MFEQKIIEFIKNNPAKILEYIKNKPNSTFGQYEKIYAYYNKREDNFKSACFSPEQNEEAILETAIESGIVYGSADFYKESLSLSKELNELNSN